VTEGLIAAIYARVSSEQQADEHTIASQVLLCAPASPRMGCYCQPSMSTWTRVQRRDARPSSSGASA